MLCSIKRRAQRKSPILVLVVVFDLDEEETTSRHGKTGQNFLIQPDQKKYLTQTRFFLTRNKNGLIRDPTRFCGSTQPE